MVIKKKQLLHTSDGGVNIKEVVLELLTTLMVDVRFSADAACSVLATELFDSDTSLRLGVELLFLFVSTLPFIDNVHFY